MFSSRRQRFVLLLAPGVSRLGARRWLGCLLALCDFRRDSHNANKASTASVSAEPGSSERKQQCQELTPGEEKRYLLSFVAGVDRSARVIRET